MANRSAHAGLILFHSLFLTNLTGISAFGDVATSIPEYPVIVCQLNYLTISFWGE